ncbi:MAG: hypothetical protein IJO93_05635 [Clostridia bacterium]|nr:hypothetical protein [Clostridia bacterium]
MKKTVVLLGNYGSGKSELALNIAVKSREKGSSVMVDLDIINPYFRSSDMENLLHEKQVDIIKPIYAGTGVEGLSLPPDVYSVFIDDHKTVVFDVGGDATGSIALGQYKRNFEMLENLEVCFVVNTCRPLSNSTDAILELIGEITATSRLDIDCIINNTNLSNETTGEVLASGYRIIEEVSKETGIPVGYTAGTREVLKQFTEYGIRHGFSPKYIGEYIEIERFMRRDWERFVKDAGVYNL